MQVDTIKYFLFPLYDSFNCLNQAERGELGSPPAMELLQYLRPSYWFAAHLHCKFAAAYRHDDGITKFLALDKCLPRGGYLQVMIIYRITIQWNLC